jgi:hypothetical protein
MNTRLSIIRFAVLCFIAYNAQQVAANPAAFLRHNDKGYYVAVKADPPLWKGSAVTPADLIKQIVASVFQKGRLVASVVGPADSYGADFTIQLPDTALTDGVSALLVAVQNYPTGQGTSSGFTASVSNEVSVTIEMRGRASCPAGFPLLVQYSDSDVMTPYGAQRIKELQKYVEKTRPAVRVESATSNLAENRYIKTPSQLFVDQDPDSGGRFFQCLELTEEPPGGTYDIEFKYSATAPIELQGPFLKTDLVNSAHTLVPFTMDDGEIGKRALEQNLDVSFQFGSSVEDKKETNDAGVEELVRRRNNKGTLDLRLAPFLNVLSLPDAGETTFKFWTPFVIDARVSTGKINEDTLALNRIVLGSEYEIRHYSNPSTFPSYQRHILSFRNASDRDFKQAEWKGGYELHPVFSALNRPLRFRDHSFKRILDDDPDRDPKDVPTTIGFGWQVLPLVGAELGKTWRNKHDFAAIEKTTFVRRFYFGTTINLDLTSFVTVSVKDVLYVRGEAWETDPLHNYFKGTIEVPFPSFTRKSASSAFFSFERGGEPPFANADVNAVKIGYRVQWDGWFGQRR